MSLNKTLIDWVKNPDGTQGYTLNIFTGCLNHINGLCKGGNFPCYAYRLAHGRLKERYLANINIAPSFMDINKVCDPDYHQESGYADPFSPRFWPERLNTLVQLGRRSGRACKEYGVFLNDMSDWAAPWWPRQWQDDILAGIEADPHDTFYTLTKWPQELIKFSPFPANCRVGVTATNYYDFVNACGYLGSMSHKGQAKMVYLSLEPLLSWEHSEENFVLDWLMQGNINWLIIGACTGTEIEMTNLAKQTKREYRYVMPHGNKWTLQPSIEWVEEIARACDVADIPLFLKDNLLPLFGAAWPLWAISNFGFRQEIPE